MRHLVIHTDSCRCQSPGVKSWLLHHSKSPAHTSLLVRNVLPNNTVFTRSGPLRLYPVSKTEEIHERTEICYDWGDKNCIVGRSQYELARHRIALSEHWLSLRVYWLSCSMCNVQCFSMELFQFGCTCNIALILFLKCDVTKFRVSPPLSHNVTLRRPPPPP